MPYGQVLVDKLVNSQSEEIELFGMSKIEERTLGVGASLYKGTGVSVQGNYAVVGDTVPAGTTHLRVLLNGKPENVLMSPVASGLVTNLTETGATIGGTFVTFINVNAHNSLTNRDDSGAHPASAIDGAVQYVNTISELVALDSSAIKDGQQVNVSSYHAGGEPHGGGVFCWSSVVPKTEHNGGTVIDPAVMFPTDWDDDTQLTTWFSAATPTGTGCWVRQYDGDIHVKWFGAKGDCDASTNVGDINYSNPDGTDDWFAFQSAIDFASKVNSKVYIDSSKFWYKIDKDKLTVTCSVRGAGRESSRLKFTDNGLNIRLSFEITSVVNGVFEDFSYDCSVSADPTNWSNNYDNFTGRRGLRVIGNGSNIVLRNINTTNTFRSGIAFFGGADMFIVDNVHTKRCRGNFGDGLYFSGTSKKCKITNCSAYDFTRIGLVTDSPDGGIIEDCVVENCAFEYGHNYSSSHGGTEFNSGVWLEQTARSVIKNCTAKNTNGRGFTVTTGGRALEIAGYSECYSVIDSCIAENTGSGYVVQALGVPANHRVVNCTTINCSIEDITGTCYGNSSNVVFISNFYSEKSFAASQSRCVAFDNSTSDGKTFVTVDGFKVKSDLNADSFAWGSQTNGHISTYSNSGELNCTISNFRDDNGIIINNRHGLRSGTWTIENCDKIYANSIRANEVIFDNCSFNRYNSNASGYTKAHHYNCTFNTSVAQTTNTDIVFDNCTFNVPDDGRLWIANDYAELNEPRKIVCRMSMCTFYKNYKGSTPYAIQFTSKPEPNKVGLLLDRCIFYNTNSDGSGGYPLYFNNGVAHVLGESWLDDTVQYFSMSFTTPQTSSTNIIKKTFQ